MMWRVNRLSSRAYRAVRAVVHNSGVDNVGKDAHAIETRELHYMWTHRKGPRP